MTSPIPTILPVGPRAPRRPGVALALVALACVAAAGGGCSSIKVTRVDAAKSSDAPGLRYSLPKAFILASPDADSTRVTAEVVYLPDEENTYGIETSTVMSQGTFQATITEDGLLQAVTYKPDSTAVPAKAAGTIGVGAKAFVDRSVALRDAKATAVNTAQADVDAADQKVKTLKKKLDVPGLTDDEKKSLRTMLAEAEADLDAKKAKLARVRRSRPTVSAAAAAADDPAASDEEASGGDPPADVPKPAGVSKTVLGGRGPTLYAIVEGVDDSNDPVVRLRAVRVKVSDRPEDGTKVPTFKVVDGLSKAATTRPAAEAKLLSTRTLAVPAGTAAVYKVDASVLGKVVALQPIGTRVEPKSDQVPAVTLPATPPVPKLDSTNSAVTVDTTGLQKGQYKVFVSATVQNAADPVGDQVDLVVQ